MRHGQLILCGLTILGVCLTFAASMIASALDKVASAIRSGLGEEYGRQFRRPPPPPAPPAWRDPSSTVVNP